MKALTTIPITKPRIKERLKVKSNHGVIIFCLSARLTPRRKVYSLIEENANKKNAALHVHKRCRAAVELTRLTVYRKPLAQS